MRCRGFGEKVFPSRSSKRSPNNNLKPAFLWRLNLDCMKRFLKPIPNMVFYLKSLLQGCK